jgi:thiosulfate/3-mercaptopyruvate sulfurtransferase
VPVLIEVAELVRRLASDQPPVLADVRWNLSGAPGLPEFQSGHIRTAQWVDLEQELSSPPGAGGRHPLPTAEVFQAAMRRIGVSANSTVVVYDGASALAASRLWWLLTDAGHCNVRVLNGGFAAWRAAGQPEQTGSAPPAASGDFVPSPGQRRRVGAGEVADAVRAADRPVIVDVRAAERYSGAFEPMDPVAGHIPGAINLPSMVNVGPDGTFVEPSRLRSRYADAGIGRSSIFYCGSGITAAHTLLALDYADLPDATIYAGSWSEWITDPAHPIATGDEP